MRSRFLSNLNPAPKGFDTRELRKRGLLGGTVAVYVESEALIQSLVEDYANRMHGTIAVPGSDYLATQIGPVLWRVTVPPAMLPFLHDVLAPMLSSIDVAAAFRDRELERQRALDRLTHDLSLTREDYNRVTSKLQAQLKELLCTQSALSESEANLRLLNDELERRVSARTSELEELNRELESFSYSVSHDLRAPLRAINGFSHLLIEDFGHALQGEASDYLRRITSAADRMDQLIDDLLALARASKVALSPQPINICTLSKNVIHLMQPVTADREIEFRIEPDLYARADERMIKVVLENLLGNAIKFTRGRKPAIIEVGRISGKYISTFFIRDNGAGFDMKAVGKLFAPFQRLHGEKEFEGTGIGLATAKRVIARHGGKIWAEGSLGEGATFFFTLPS
jgi:signal transduction histidine kinase